METLFNSGIEATQSQQSEAGAQVPPTTEASKASEGATSEIEPAQVEVKSSETASANEPEKKETSNVVVNYDDLKVEKDSLLTEEHLADIKSYAKQKGLSHEQAKEIMLRESSAIQKHEQLNQQRLEKDALHWAELSKKDPEIGGEKFDASVQLAKRALEKVASEKFVQFLEQSKLGNHPEVIRVFARFGELFQDDKVVNARTNNVKSKDYSELFYTSKQ